MPEWSCGSFSPTAIRPLPSSDFRAVDAVLIGVVPAGKLLVAQFFLGVCADALKLGNSVNCVNCKAEPVGLVVDGQFHGCVDVALLFVATHMKVMVVGAAIGEAVNQPWIAMEVEDNRLIGGK